MAMSTESPDRLSGRLGRDWRATAGAAQQAFVPADTTVVSCPAPLGGGGLGRHLQEIVGALERAGGGPAVICESQAPAPLPGRLAQTARRRGAQALAPLGRVSAAWRAWAASVSFDAFAAERLAQAEHLIAFNGSALAQLRLAGRLRYRTRALVAANSHFRHVLSQHARAHAQYPLEAPWPRRLLARNLAEYELADRIYVASRYIRDSFLERGFAEERLSTFPLTPAPRFSAEPRAPSSATFDVVYVGSLTVHKGVPLLLDAFRRLPHDDMRLTLVGGWKTRAMRRFVQRACAEDERIAVRPGDPLAHLRSARLCVHPAYEDGFAYAPAEALACGVPVLVSEDTGMKELIGAVGGGAILPTGDLDALTVAIDAAYRGGSLGG
jgi:glycosyltransferase involved in cell wall biosynthesis